MSKSDSMFIAFSHGGILPSSITGGDERRVGPHEPVRVPRSYGEHLIADRFAYEAEAPKKKADPAAAALQKQLQDLEARLSDGRAAVAAATDLAEKGRLEAEVADLEAELEKLKKD